jgi:tetratricopeptide (TPR) repeat protein
MDRAAGKPKWAATDPTWMRAQEILEAGMPWRSAVVAGLAVILTSMISATALGQGNGEVHRECYHGSTSDRIIASCSAIIRDRLGDMRDIAAAFKIRADTYDDKGEYEVAVRDYTEALALEPLDAEVFKARGTTWTALGQYEIAIKDFDRAIELEAGKGMAFSNRCFAKAVLGRLDAALKDCNEAIRLYPGRYPTFAARGFVYLKLGQADEAIADYNTVLANRLEDPYALFGRAAAKLMKGDLKGSDDDVVHAQAIKPDIADDMDRIGIRLSEVFRQRGQ